MEWTRRQVTNAAVLAAIFGTGYGRGSRSAVAAMTGGDAMKRSIGAALRPELDGTALPGMVFALERHGALTLAAIGHQDIAAETDMRTDAIFRIASLTKPVTALATMMLVEEGVLRLDEPVDRLLPELAERRVLTALDAPLDNTVPAERPITVEDLLTCRMGMGAILAPGDYPIVEAMFERGVGVGPWLPDAESGDAWLASLGELPLMRQPGTAWLYDTSFIVLGILLERASGFPLAELYRRRIFEPLGMADTGFAVPPEKLDRLPPCYWRNYQTGAVEVFDPAGAESRFARPPGLASAAGGLVSTARDYLAFARLMLARGTSADIRLISEQSYRRMTRDHITPAQRARSPFGEGFWETTGWGYGVAIRRARAKDEPQGFGWDGGYGTTCLWNHDTGAIGLLFSQRAMDSPAAPPQFRAFWSATASAFRKDAI